MPAGRSSLLAERMVADGKIDTISPSKVQMTFKKQTEAMRLKCWCIATFDTLVHQADGRDP
ncbi:MAG: hypothetical protein M9965_11045 [Anaerolineae bacterium]|nr:hypothetical protein [Anaerolineae bacterium]